MVVRDQSFGVSGVWLLIAGGLVCIVGQRLIGLGGFGAEAALGGVLFAAVVGRLISMSGGRWR